MLKGFREFVLRGNVIDLAVAVVIGAAFTAVVNSIVTSVINPLIGAIWDADSLDNALNVQVGNSVVQFGAVIGAIVQFLIVAVVVYFVFVAPINHLKKAAFRLSKQRPAEEIAEPPSEAVLLAEIRDLIAAQNAALVPARGARPEPE